MQKTFSELLHYLAHSFFQGFSRNLFFAFGALLLYVKSNSILLVILYTLFVYITSTSVRSVGLPLYLRFVRVAGVYTTLVLGLLFGAGAYLLIYFSSFENPYFYLLYFGSALLHGLSAGFYWTITSAVSYGLLSRTDRPGQFSYYIKLVSTAASLLAAVTALVLNINDNFVLLFLIACGMMVMSIIPLRYITFPNIPVVRFRDCIKTISRATYFGNFAPHYRFERTLLPLIIVLVFSSLHKSVWIVGVSAALSVVFAYFTAHLKDRKINGLNYIAVIILPLIWVAYGFAWSDIQFILLGMLLQVFTTIMIIGRDVRMGQEFHQAGHSFERSVAFEFARSTGGIIGLLIILGLYLIFGQLHQWFLVIGALLTLYPVLYSIGVGKVKYIS